MNFFCLSFPPGLVEEKGRGGEQEGREVGGGMGRTVWKGEAVLRSRKYLFSAPTLSIISALAPAPTQATATAIYCHLKLFYNSSTISNRKKKIAFLCSSILQTDCRKCLFRFLTEFIPYRYLEGVDKLE